MAFINSSITCLYNPEISYNSTHYRLEVKLHCEEAERKEIQQEG